MTITLWTIFEILINFYQGGLETWFIYKFLTPRSHERAKIWAVIFAVCEGCLVTAFNYFTVFEGFGSALYWASLLVFAFCFFSDNAVKKFLSISLSQVAILLITSLELNAVSSFFKISLRELVVEQSLLRFVTLIMIQISIFIVFRLILMAFKHTDDYTASDWVTIIAVFIAVRVITGGYHADTYFRCNLLMCSTFIATAFLNDKVCGYINIWVIAAFVVFEEIIAFVFCPVENKNKPIEKEKKPKFKAMGMIVFLLLDLFGGAIINRYQMVGSMILLTNLLIAVLIISAKIKEKRCDKNEII